MRKVGFEGNLGVIPNIVEINEKYLTLTQQTKPRDIKICNPYFNIKQ